MTPPSTWDNNPIAVARSYALDVMSEPKNIDSIPDLCSAVLNLCDACENLERKLAALRPALEKYLP